MVNNLTAKQETQARSLGREDILEEEMATHSSILPGGFHGQRSLTGYSPWSRKESDTTERLSLSLFTFSSWERPDSLCLPCSRRRPPPADDLSTAALVLCCLKEGRAGTPVHLGACTITAIARSGLDTQGSCRGDSREDLGTDESRGRLSPTPALALRCVQSGASLHSDFCSAACELCSLRQTIPPL